MVKINKTSSRAEVMLAIKKNGMNILSANMKFLKDKPLILTALKQRYFNLEQTNSLIEWGVPEQDIPESFIFNYIHKSLFKDRDICVALLNVYQWDMIEKELIDKSLFNDIKFFQKCFKFDHQHIDDSNMDEESNIKYAIYSRASSAIKKNKSIAMKLLKEGEGRLKIFHKPFLKDKKFLLTWLNYYALSGYDLDSDMVYLKKENKIIFKDKNFCLLLVNKDSLSIDRIDISLQEDPDILKAAGKNKP
tara:strand:+ start:51 stop:794 length:744 start_codon:yes stop_codon:yes gene_type:complete